MHLNTQPTRILASLLFLVLFTTLATAQIQGLPSNYSVSQVANGLAADGNSMAVDRFGNIYMRHAGSSGVPDRITRISANGAINENFVSNLGAIGQLARHPVNGLVYFTSYSPMLPVIHSTVHEITMSGAVMSAYSLTMVAKGLTIDNTGKFYFGGMGLLGSGLYVGTPNPGSLNISLAYLGSGHGQNEILQSLVNGDVLVADGMEVRRWSTPSPITGLSLYYQAPLIGNTMTTLGSLARNPFNPLESGAFIGQNVLTTLCMCGVGSAIPGKLLHAGNAPFATEGYSLPRNGLLSLTDGTQDDIYWLSDNAAGVTPGPGPNPFPLGRTLYRIRNTPAAGEIGTLDVAFFGTTTGSFVASFNVYGNSNGGDPVVLGVAPGAVPFTQTWYNTLGWFDLDPLAAYYMPIADGIGLFGAADPTAVIPPGGHFTRFVPIPASVPAGLTFATQALIVAPYRAPNGIVVVSNLEISVTP